MKRLALPLLALLLAVAPVHAQETRPFQPIRSPHALSLPAGAVPVAQVRPVPREVVTQGLQEILRAWNTPKLEQYLSDNFPDRSRLLDTLALRIPRDAVLRVLAVQGMQVLDQYRMPREGGGEDLITRMAVTVRLQVEFTDPALGFQRREGTNEFVLRLVEPA
jgi:hypothetical protein